MLKISVITPSFNQGAFINRCLESVRAQRGDFAVEHIILDNCSTDETVQALTNYQSNHGDVELQIIIEKDGGQTAAINKGFSLATGDVICWLNTDEWYEEGALVKVVNYLNEHPEADVVFGGCNFVDIIGRLIKQKNEFFYVQSMLVYYGCFIPSCATFIRRRVIDAGVFLDTSYRVSMDHEWYCKIAINGFIFRPLKTIIANFTCHNTNLSSNTPLAKRHVEWNKTRLKYGGISFLPNNIRLKLFDLYQWAWVIARVVYRTWFRIIRL